MRKAVGAFAPQPRCTSLGGMPTFLILRRPRFAPGLEGTHHSLARDLPNARRYDPHRRHLEHQLGAAAHPAGRAVPRPLPARHPVPAGDQVPGRPLPGEAVPAARLRAHPGQRPEGLSRRRHRLARAVRRDRQARLLRARAMPPRLASTIADDGGDDPPPQFLRPGRRRRARPGGQREVRPQARLPRRDAGLARPAPRPTARRSWSAISTSRRSRPTCGRTSSCCASSATRRSRPTALEEVRAAGRLGRRGAPFRAGASRSSTRGGATAPPTGQAADKGRRLDHIWVTPHLAGRLAQRRGDPRGARLAAAVGPCAGDRPDRAGGWCSGRCGGRPRAGGV